METIVIPNENDFKKWVSEAIGECLKDFSEKLKQDALVGDELLSRKEIAKFLCISLVTLTDWIKRGLPSHKQRGRVYFIKTEVLEYLKEKKINKAKFCF